MAKAKFWEDTNKETSLLKELRSKAFGTLYQTKYFIFLVKPEFCEMQIYSEFYSLNIKDPFLLMFISIKRKTRKRNHAPRIDYKHFPT